MKEGENFHCYWCGDSFPDEYFSCHNCKFCPSGCSACGNNLYSSSASAWGCYYICEQCWPETPVFHQSCAELPHEIQISFHPHASLHLAEKSSLYDMMIKPSDQKKEKQIYEFCCEECSFEIGYGSAAMLMQCQEGNQEHIKHICHEHPLTLIMMKEDYGPCKLCDVIIRGPTYGYGCTPCEFYAHKSYFELPHQVRHHFHPSHFLVLETKRFDSENIPYCQACGSLCRGFRYQCSAYCAFSLHIECATLAPNIKYIGHTQHLVIRIDHVDMDISSQGRGWACNACGFDIDHQVAAPFLRCVECDLNFHEECDTELIKHFSHPHPLVLCDNEEEETNDDKVCYACNKLIQAGPAAYICNSCKSCYLHKSCSELPRRIQHRFHKNVLTLVYTAASRQCKACCKYFNGFTYNCSTCNFYLDLDCVSPRPLLIFRGHEHKLTIFDKLYSNQMCQGSCNFTSPNAYYLRCVKCDFNIHLWCIPLPETIKHESHHHSLILADKLANDDYEDEVCDICEEQRDRRECAYYCAECDFVAEFSCVRSLVRRPIIFVHIYMKCSLPQTRA